MPTIQDLTQIPTGGALSLTFTVVSGVSSIQRSTQVSGQPSTWLTVYSQNVVEIDPYNRQFYIDVGDGLPGPLDTNTLYYYQVIDSTGFVISDPIQPIAQLSLQEEPITEIMIRLFQAGFNNLLRPSAFRTPPTVLAAMPLQGAPPMPMCVIYREMLQQADQQIGEDFPNPDQANQWVISENAKFIYRISLLSNSSEERDFYALAVIGICKIIKAYVLANIGKNVSHSWQAAQYQVSNRQDGQIPGFYGADVMFTFEGIFNMLVTTDLSFIETISLTVVAQVDPSLPGIVEEIIIPNESTG